jgi:Fe-S oxidoreductase
MTCVASVSKRPTDSSFTLQCKHWAGSTVEQLLTFKLSRTRVADEWANREGLIDKINDHEACDSCMQCEKRCPYGLPIVSMLRTMVPNMQDMLDIWSKESSKA